MRTCLCHDHTLFLGEVWILHLVLELLLGMCVAHLRSLLSDLPWTTSLAGSRRALHLSVLLLCIEHLLLPKHRDVLLTLLHVSRHLRVPLRWRLGLSLHDLLSHHLATTLVLDLLDLLGGHVIRQ